MAEMVDNPMGAAAQAASEVRDDLRSIQQDIPADDLAKLYDALEMWESHGDLRGDRASLQGNLAREVHTLKSDIGVEVPSQFAKSLHPQIRSVQW